MGGFAWSQSFLLVTDNRRSRLDSPFSFYVITQHRKFEFGYTGKVKKISNAQELTIQLSQTLSSAIAQISFTNHTKKDLAPAPSSFFQFLHNLKINFLYIVLMGRAFQLFFLPLAVVVVEERF